MLPAAHRLHDAAGFRETVRTGRRTGSRTLVVHLATPGVDSPAGPAVVGFVVSRAVGGTAVPPAQLTMSGAPIYDYGQLVAGASADAVITVTNGGGVAAGAITGSGLNAPFGFKGAAYQYDDGVQSSTG